MTEEKCCKPVPPLTHVFDYDKWTRLYFLINIKAALFIIALKGRYIPLDSYIPQDFTLYVSGTKQKKNDIARKHCCLTSAFYGH